MINDDLINDRTDIISEKNLEDVRRWLNSGRGGHMRMCANSIILVKRGRHLLCWLIMVELGENWLPLIMSLHSRIGCISDLTQS